MATPSTVFLPSISLVGAGNVAWGLGLALQCAGFPIVSVHSRGNERGTRLANRFNCPLLGDAELEEQLPRLYLLTVPDDAIAPVGTTLLRLLYPRVKTLPANTPLPIVGHTSGSSPLLQSQHIPTGVLYPFQRFGYGSTPRLSDAPFFIEGSDAKTEATLIEIARHLSSHVEVADSPTRQWVHLLGVLACNFTNHLLAAAQRVAEAQGIAPGVIQPLVEETVAQAFRLGAANAQTGPAARGDQATIARHLQMLGRRFPELAPLYSLMSEQIAAQTKGNTPQC